MASIEDPESWIAYGQIDPELAEVCPLWGSLQGQHNIYGPGADTSARY